RAHDIQADAAAGDAGHPLGGGEARCKDESLDLRLRHLLDLNRGGETARDRGSLDPLGVQAGTVVGDVDHDVPAFVASAETDRALFGLSGGAPFGGHFETM